MKQNGKGFFLSLLQPFGEYYGGLSSPIFLIYHRAMNDEMSEFLATLLHSSTVTHFLHWSTDSYAKHKALAKYYDGIIDLTDTLAEAYMGRYEQIKKFPEEFHSAKDPVKYLESLREFVQESREDLPQDSEIQNIIDEIADLINSTLYKLRFLN
jgi:DNA-binding ferritin-like protein